MSTMWRRILTVEANQIEKWRQTISTSSDNSLLDAVSKRMRDSFMSSLKGKYGSHEIAPNADTENVYGKWKLGEVIGKGFTGVVREGWIPPSDIRVSLSLSMFLNFSLLLPSPSPFVALLFLSLSHFLSIDTPVCGESGRFRFVKFVFSAIETKKVRVSLSGCSYAYMFMCFLHIALRIIDLLTHFPLNRLEMCLQTEIRALEVLHHPNIVRLEEWFCVGRKEGAKGEERDGSGEVREERGGGEGRKEKGE